MANSQSPRWSNFAGFLKRETSLIKVYTLIFKVADTKIYKNIHIWKINHQKGIKKKRKQI